MYACARIEELSFLNHPSCPITIIYNIYFTSRDPCPDILFQLSTWHPFWRSFWHSIWHMFWHSIWHSMWHLALAKRSRSAHWHLALALGARQCPLRSGPRGWRPAVPTAIWRSLLRRRSAHWDLELAVEVQQCPLRSGPCGWGRRRAKRVTDPSQSPQTSESGTPLDKVSHRWTLAQYAGKARGGDRESATKSPSPLEAGRRIKEHGGKQKVNNKESVTLEGESRNPRGKQKVNNKESVTLEGESRNPRGKQKVNNKESVTLEGESRNPGETESQQQKESATPESYLSIYLTVYLSISLSIKEPMGTWKNWNVNNKESLKKP